MWGDMKDAAIYRPIGHVENAFDKRAAPDVIAAAESRIILDPTLAEGLEGVEEGQQLLVIFHFHRVERVRPTATPPRGHQPPPPRRLRIAQPAPPQPHRGHDRRSPGG